MLLSDVVSSIRNGESGYAFVTTASVRLIAHPDLSLVLRDTDLSALPEVAALPGRGGGRDSEITRGLDDGFVLAAHPAIPGVGWIVFVQLPLREAMEPLIESVIQTVALMGLGVMMAAAGRGGGSGRPDHEAHRFRDPQSRDRAAARPACGDGMIEGLPSAKILVVVDEPDLKALITQKFRRQIHQGVVTFLFAHDGQEALDSLSEHRDVDMVVSDINMPRRDGLTLLAKLKDFAEQPSTIIVSAYGDMADIRTAMSRGAFDFLMKPIDFADLETTIGRTLRHVEAVREGRRRQLMAERAPASLARYFSPNVAERLAGDASGLEFGGHRRDLATLFTDITGFTSLVESIDPALLAEILNGYLAEMTDIVFAHEGTVAKIVGDALHVLRPAPRRSASAGQAGITSGVRAPDRGQLRRGRAWPVRGCLQEAEGWRGRCPAGLRRPSRPAAR